MKRTLILFVILLCSYSALYAQPNRLRAVSLTLEGPNGEDRELMDTVLIIYNSANLNIGTAEQFDAETLPCDTVLYCGPDMKCSKRYSYHYDAQGRTDTILREIPDSDTTFRSQLKYGYEFDAAGRVLYEYRWVYATALYRTRYIYNNTNLVEKQEEAYSNTVGWVMYEQYLYAYNAHGLQRYELRNKNSSGNWQTGQLDEWIYNATGQIDTVRHYSADVSGTTASGFDLWTYDGGPLPARKYYFSYNPVAAVYDTSGYRGFSYYANGMMKDDSLFTYNPLLQKVVPYGISRISYTPTGKVDTSFSILWTTSQNYAFGSSEIRNYNADGLITNKAIYYQDATGKWVRHARGEVWYYYYDFATGIKETANRQAIFTLYPNPAADVLMLSFKQADMQPRIFSIYDAMGRLQRTWQLQQGQQMHTIPVSDLQAGTYTLTISNGAGKQSQQFVVAR